MSTQSPFAHSSTVQVLYIHNPVQQIRIPVTVSSTTDYPEQQLDRMWSRVSRAALGSAPDGLQECAYSRQGTRPRVRTTPEESDQERGLRQLSAELPHSLFRSKKPLLAATKFPVRQHRIPSFPRENRLRLRPRGRGGAALAMRARASAGAPRAAPFTRAVPTPRGSQGFPDFRIPRSARF